VPSVIRALAHNDLFDFKAAIGSPRPIYCSERVIFHAKAWGKMGFSQLEQTQQLLITYEAMSILWVFFRRVVVLAASRTMALRSG